MDKAFEIEEGTVAQVPLSLIEADPNQPRKHFEEKGLQDLADDIKANGVQQPITVRNHPEEPGRFFIVYGERRFRASQLANKKAIPALLYTGKKTDELARLLNQVKENHLRDDLDAIEWANLFYVMNKVHGLKQADIEAELKKHNVGNFGRAYISNIMRLRDLPQWAQDLIAAGTLTAAHGKHLLPAMASEPVMESLEKLIKESREVLTTRDLQKAVYRTFDNNHIQLTSYHTKFDYAQECVKSRGCQKMRKISNGHMDDTFCLDAECHKKLNAEAKAAQTSKQQRQTGTHEPDEAPAPKKEIKVNDNNEVMTNEQDLEWGDDFWPLERVSFDKTECDGCPHRHTAVCKDEWDDEDEVTHHDACFNIDCYTRKEQEHDVAKSQVNHFLEKTIGNKLEEQPEAAANILFWIATNAPKGKRASLHSTDGEEFVMYSNNYIDESDELDELLIKHDTTTLDDFLAGKANTVELVKFALADWWIEPKAMLARHLGISIDDYRIDEFWIAQHESDEISAFLNGIALPPVLFAELETAEGEAFEKLLLENADTIGVPAAVRYAFNELTNDKDED